MGLLNPPTVEHCIVLRYDLRHDRQVIVVGIDVCGRGLLNRLLLCGGCLYPKPFHHLVSDLIFEAEDVGTAQVVALRPFRVSRIAIDQLHGDPDRARSALVRAFQHALDTQGLCDFRGFRRFLGVFQD